MKNFIHPSINDIHVEHVLYALGDPIRLKILLRLSDKEKEEYQCHELSFDRPKSSMAYHFKVLRECGIVRCRKEGREHFNSSRKVELDEKFPSLIDAIINSKELEDKLKK